MRVRWLGLELPSRVVRDEAVSTDRYGRFTIEPFERGFGTTVGNSLRRILLSSLEGSAVTHARIAGADHEFMSLTGVLEDVTDIILNIKSLVVELDSDTPKTMRVERNEKGEVRARDFVCDPAITLHTPDQLIATLTDKVNFSAELTVERGRGYVPASEFVSDTTEIGVIPVDAVFSPVTRVRYRVEDTRVGQRVNYDRLVMEIWTKGTTKPEDALVEAAKILRKHLNPFVQYYELGSLVTAADPRTEPPPSQMDDELRAKLDQSLATLELSVRASNCLEAAKISTIGELVRLSEAELLELRSFGKTSLLEVKEKLGKIGLRLGMSLPFESAPPDLPAAAEAENSSAPL
ncbi:MAG: DNA-directed RNA polymerase subunit alpha [Phycisphaerales bacterium]|nr:DNA-directed RNA polymerase subunit alpha [Phycisphaerales bacterium]